MHLSDLETPALIVDRLRLEANARRMRERAETRGLALRPHLKTTKSAAIARIAHGGQVGPGTVSTLREAEYFLEHGFADLTYAVCITPNKFAHAAALIDRGAALKLLLAHEAIARALAEFAGERDTAFELFIEIDCGDGRTGFLPDADGLVATARLVADAAGLTLAGLLTHGGHSYGCSGLAEIEAVAEDERTALLAARDRLAAAGITANLLSSGSTPTALVGRNFSGLSELRPGVYLTGDLFQAGLGVLSLDDVAVSVLATVIAADDQRVVIDAGGLALSKDRGVPKTGVDRGFGLVVHEDGRIPDDAPFVAGVSQEHGVIAADARRHASWLAVGSRVRVLPNHACMTAAPYDRYFVVDDRSVDVTDEWHKVSGW